jgi:hypothetical protein
MDAGKQVEAWLLNCAVLSEAEVSHMGYGEAGRSIVAELQHEDKRQVVEAWLLFWQSAFVTRRHTFSEGD